MRQTDQLALRAGGRLRRHGGDVGGDHAHAEHEVVDVFFERFSTTSSRGVHAVHLNLEQAGFHTVRMSVVPGDEDLIQLPPYSPELNPVDLSILVVSLIFKPPDQDLNGVCKRRRSKVCLQSTKTQKRSRPSAILHISQGAHEISGKRVSTRRNAIEHADGATSMSCRSRRTRAFGKWLLILAVSLAGASPALAQREAETLSASFRKAAEKMLPSVVAVRPIGLLGRGVPFGMLGRPVFPGGLDDMPGHPGESDRLPGGSGVVVGPESGTGTRKRDRYDRGQKAGQQPRKRDGYDINKGRKAGQKRDGYDIDKMGVFGLWFGDATYSAGRSWWNGFSRDGKRDRGRKAGQKAGRVRGKRDRYDIDKMGSFGLCFGDATDSEGSSWWNGFSRLESRRGANAVVRESGRLPSIRAGFAGYS